MSFLAPLYALGLLAVAGPILFHLIRRRPKGEQPFSSLMFLTASPPPPARRRRLDQLLLLLLRAAVLILVGLAFMRPFLRDDSTAAAAEAGERVVILIDTSGSMRRVDLWPQAVGRVEVALERCKPTDRLAVFAFDRTVRPLMTFAESEQLEPQQRAAVVRDRIGQLRPTWGGTALGPALVEAAGAILESAGGARSTGRVVLVSDLPQGARLDGLAGFEWPAEITLDLQTVSAPAGNAGLSWLVDRQNTDPTAEADRLRVRVVNEPASPRESFRLAWSGTPADEVEAYVPPGESRVVQVTRPQNGTPTLVLKGDAHEFDNTLFLAAPPREEFTVVYLGTDAADDPAGRLYFLQRTWGETPERKVTVDSRSPTERLAAEDLRRVPLVVVDADVAEETAAALDGYLKSGGTVLAVLTAGRPANALAELAGVPALAVEEADLKQYAMLRDIQFEHPLFAPLVGPQFSDFTKVSFWKYRKVPEDQFGGRVLARFDDGTPAVLEKPVGRGRLVVFTSGWQPSDSQLARSTKFVPMMTALLELRSGRQDESTNYQVGDRVPLPAGTTDLRKPDGMSVTLPADAASFAGTDQPGVYTLTTPGGPRPFAVNLDSAESLTAPMPVETLEQFGCRLTKSNAAEDRQEQDRQQQNAELERDQSIWRWLVLAAVALVLAETGLAGWRSRPTPNEGGTP